MRHDELHAADGAISLPAAIPVICDRCRHAGTAGDAPFADLADLLSFTPVHRRARADGWDAQRQRAFIAALAVTGSPRQAARAIGKHTVGAEQLRKARGGSSFAAAWDAALDIARERELAGLHDGLTELAASTITNAPAAAPPSSPRPSAPLAPPARAPPASAPRVSKAMATAPRKLPRPGPPSAHASPTPAACSSS